MPVYCAHNNYFTGIIISRINVQIDLLTVRCLSVFCWLLLARTAGRPIDNLVHLTYKIYRSKPHKSQFSVCRTKRLAY